MLLFSFFLFFFFLLFTCFFVEHDLVFKLLSLLQGLANTQDDAFAGLRPVQELAGAALLHDLGPRAARELAEAIRAVDDGKALQHLRISQDEVAVCRRETGEVRGPQSVEVITPVRLWANGSKVTQFYRSRSSETWSSWMLLILKE